MTKKQILDDMIEKHNDYVNDWKNEDKWNAYVKAWHNWRSVKGDE